MRIKENTSVAHIWPEDYRFVNLASNLEVFLHQNRWQD